MYFTHNVWIIFLHYQIFSGGEHNEPKFSNPHAKQVAGVGSADDEAAIVIITALTIFDKSCFIKK